MNLKRSILLFLLVPFAATLHAVQPLVFESEEQEERFNNLTVELRCLVCQNQTISDSDAPLAQDLRKEIHDMMIAGRSDAEIKEFMVARYGDFVLYRPPVQSNTIVLWFLPLLLFVIGGALVWRAVHKRSTLLDDEATNRDGQA